MNIDDALIQKLEILSKLKLEDAEKVVLKSELSSVLDMFDKIGEVDTSGVKPLTHMTDTVNEMRSDVVQGQLLTDEALKNAPKAVGSFFAVPKVID
ncbi:MAG: Asp-tRNA(Asn)/Glu-tRNA(Gln) amidotransferase subunit GatC [Saprospiraceae bacterium]